MVPFAVLVQSHGGTKLDQGGIMEDGNLKVYAVVPGYKERVESAQDSGCPSLYESREAAEKAAAESNAEFQDSDPYTVEEIEVKA